MCNLLTSNIESGRQAFESLASMHDQVAAATELIADALIRGNKLLTCGNGGSAAEASHLATEFVCRYNVDRRPYPAISLAANGGDLTAISNDYAFEDVFSRQVEAFGKPGDVLVVFSTSGRSPNVVRALQAAQRMQIRTVSLLGRNGGACAGLAEIELIVNNDVTARIQECHQLLLHTLCEGIEQRLANRR